MNTHNDADLIRALARCIDAIASGRLTDRARDRLASLLAADPLDPPQTPWNAGNASERPTVGGNAPNLAIIRPSPPPVGTPPRGSGIAVRSPEPPQNGPQGREHPKPGYPTHTYTPPPSPPDPPDSQAIGQVFRHWQLTGSHHRARLTPERAKAVRARLRQGYTVADILRAIDGCAASEFHTTGGYDDLTLICRNGSKLEAFIAKAGDVPTTIKTNYEDDQIETLRNEMKEARNAGNQTEYQRLNSKFADLRKHRGGAA